MRTTDQIDWYLLPKALSYYRHAGFEYVETPWYVGPEAIRMTLPPRQYGYYLGHPEYSPGHLVGSAEQGFLQLLLDGKLKPGKYVSAGPCFRDDHVDETHMRSFFKVELIEIESSVSPLDDDNIHRIMMHAKCLFEELSSRCCEVVQTAEGYDIELGKLEIGSYGIRKVGSHRWIYGTGLALPRFSQACALK